MAGGHLLVWLAFLALGIPHSERRLFNLCVAAVYAAAAAIVVGVIARRHGEKARPVLVFAVVFAGFALLWQIIEWVKGILGA
jgi:hypothetical protein